MLEECAQRRLGDAVEHHLVERLGQGYVARQFDQPAAQPRHIGVGDQILAQFARLHARRGSEHGFDIAIFVDQFGGGLGADPGDAGDIVDRIAHQREHFAQFLRPDTEFLDHRLRPHPPVTHRIEHVDAGLGQQLHQILVGADHRYLPALRQRRLGVRRDQIVRLPPGFLDARQRKGARRIADHRELRDEILGRGGALRLILIVHLVAEGVLGGVEDHREMGRAVGLVQLLGELPQHRRIAIDRPGRLAVLVGELGQDVIGAEDIARAIDEVEMRHGRGIARIVRGTNPACGVISRLCRAVVGLIAVMPGLTRHPEPQTLSPVTRDAGSSRA